ncbi:hypothetical protein IQ06DRAFT_371770 [Phaeosphaeriaceae sp. SRC1lsM3a]|nr:hypothetical protein IQ06DRAFT_371770 [Stagonospora sp. SRC1lsM3a]
MAHDSTFLQFLRKEWPQEFSKARKPLDDRPYLEGLLEAVRASRVEADDGDHQQQLVEVEPDSDLYQLFTQAYVDDVVPIDLRSATRFLQAIKGLKFHDQIKTKPKGTGWLDDRTRDPRPTLEFSRSATDIRSHECDIVDAVSIPPEALQAANQGSNGFNPMTRRSRKYPAPLNAVELHTYLREKEFDHDEYFDANRRLIYIADPDAFDFWALITAARAHQERALRDAICKHLALRTSIRTTISQGYSEFQMEFHIPFFAMRRSRPKQDFVRRKKRTHRGWMNLSFLDSKDADPEVDGVCGIHQAHISVTVGGTDNMRWFVYCFEDRYFDEDGQLGQDEQTEEHQSDQIAKGEFGAENPIWNPREYFLRVLLIRMSQVQKEWKELVRYIETGIKEYSWGRYFFSAARDGTPQIVDENAASSRLDSTLHLLCKLMEDIAETNDAWTRFTSATGDWAFFLDTQPDSRMLRTFRELNDVFEDLRKIETRLKRLAAQCEKRAQTVNLRLASDSKRSAELTVFFISPFAIVSTFFAIPVPIISFNRNLSSFLIAMLLYTVVLQALLFFWGGALGRQQWWQKLSRRAKAVLHGDPGLTTQQKGATVLQRRSTYSGSV